MSLRRLYNEALALREVGEFFDQAFVRLAENVRLRSLEAKVDAGKMLDQIAEQRIGKAAKDGCIKLTLFSIGEKKITESN